MKKSNSFLWLLLLSLCSAQYCFSLPDYYNGDSAVYTGSATGARPNIMFLIDNSGAMKEIGSQEPYDPDVDYGSLLDDDATIYPADNVYLRNVANENNTVYQTQKFTVDEVECSRIADVQGNYDAADYEGDYKDDYPNGDGYDDASGEIHPRYALEQNGFWYGALDSKGACPDNENQWENYFTGNFRNYLQNTQDTQEWDDWKAAEDYQLGDIVDPSDYDILFKCIEISGAPGASEPVWNPDSVADGPVPGTIVYDGGITWEALGTVLDMVQYQMEHVVFEQVRAKANMGLMTFGENNHGGAIIEPILAAGPGDTNGDVNYAALITGLGSLDNLVNGNTQPVNESFWDAYLYWIGQSDSSDGIASDKAAYPSPIEHWCQGNHLVVLTTGSAGNNSQTKTKVGDTDGDGNEGLVDDVSKLMYDSLGLDIDGYQPRVHTHIIQLMTPYVQRLEFATDNSHGHGKYYNIKNPQELIDALLAIIGGILEENSSFVAPVVPASPDNRAYSGKRIYLGFFKPMNEEPWYGNLKKFGLGYDSRIKGFDASNNEVNATYVYPDDTDDPKLDGYFYIDTDGNPAVRSYWGTAMDGGEVNLGGVGGLLKNRTSDRNIYTYLGASALNAAGNSFTTTNSALTASMLGVADSLEKDNLISYIRGYDAYAEFSSSTADKRPWILGDIMHSKPVVLNYSSYAMSDANEANAAVNKAYIFVGSNDGMLHAFKDATGEEAWAFIPPELLPDLQYIRDTSAHEYFVDNSPVLYVNDKNGDATIDSDDGDKAILICGMRRGGGNSTIDDSSVSSGSYFALDVTDPEAPQFLWQINNLTPDAAEMGQTWSLPRLTKIRTGTDASPTTTVVAIFGAGYDTNEDLRFGNTQSFPTTTDATTITSEADSGAEAVTSSSGAEPYSPRGRGIFVVEVATLNNGVATISGGGTLLWSYTFEDADTMKFAMPSDPLVVDRDSDGYTDHIYIGDTGGQLWRFNIATRDTSGWSGTRIFQANVGASDVGRKIFYKPTATVSGSDTFIYFGSGDREHPLNTAVIDRFYVVRDRESGDNTWAYTSPLTESNLVDVTENLLQDSSTDEDTKDLLRSKLTPPYDDILDYSSGATATYFYGWYIKLDEHAGEKVLAIPKVFSNILFFTTYTPAVIDTSDPDYDPCTGVLGPARLYAVNAQTGEAVFNLYAGNDTTDANGDAVEVLERPDRTINVGDGISSEPLIIINDTGAMSIMVGRGGGFFNSGAVQTIDPVFPVYWMKW